jgi:hypothetical protein
LAKLTKSFLSLVAVGSQNPQILNIDFLKQNKILPLDDPTFNEFIKDKPPTEFVSLPGFSKMVLNNIEFHIDVKRFQIRDNAVSDWLSTRILPIAVKYFEILPHTPLSAIGLNFNFTMDFESESEEQKLIQALIPHNKVVSNLISSDKVDANCSFIYHCPEIGAQLTISIQNSINVDHQRILNMNFQSTPGTITAKEIKQFSDKFSHMVKKCTQMVEGLLSSL